jgi:hypothetical protein
LAGAVVAAAEAGVVAARRHRRRRTHALLAMRHPRRKPADVVAGAVGVDVAAPLLPQVALMQQVPRLVLLVLAGAVADAEAPRFWRRDNTLCG